MKALIVYFTLLAAMPAIRSQVEPYGTEICRLFADDVQLRLAGSCYEYVTCKGGQSIPGDCGSAKFYNKDTQACVKSAPDAYCKDPCTSKSPFWVSDPRSCTGYYKCVEGTGTLGACPSGLNFEQSSQACVYPDESTCQGYDYCDVVANNVPFKDESSCDVYFMCVKSKLTEYRCDNGYYDAQRGCVPRSEVECEDHPSGVSACGTNKRPILGFISDERTCRGYWYCDDKGEHTPDLDPFWGQCPEGSFFDSDQQACVPPPDVVCVEDRCDGRNREKVISGTLGCQNYLVCDGDVTIAEEKCADGMFFDDQTMECTADVKTYVACS